MKKYRATDERFADMMEMFESLKEYEEMFEEIESGLEGLRKLGWSASKVDEWWEEAYCRIRASRSVPPEKARYELFKYKAMQKMIDQMKNQPRSPQRQLYEIAYLIAALSVNGTSFYMDMLKIEAGKYINRGEVMPPLLARFVLEQFESDQPFTLNKRGRPGSTEAAGEKMTFVELIKSVQSAGSPLRDSVEMKGAFTIVAEKTGISPERVEMYWMEHHRQERKINKAYEEMLASLPDDEVQEIRVGEEEAKVDGLLGIWEEAEKFICS